ncbi:S-layer homology domain-containing protein, partial [Paenibacillus marinisediminis]
KEQSVAVKYMLEGTKTELNPATSKSGKTGETVKLEAIDIDGYTKVAPTEVNYTFTAESNQEQIFYYTANEQSVAVKYMLEGTKTELNPATSKSGKTGEPVKLEAIDIAGYTKVAPTEVNYTFTAESNQEHIFYYTANEQSVVVKYLEEGSNRQLIDPITVTGVTDQTKELKAEEIPGYTALEPSKVEYKFSVGASGEHIFYYTANDLSVTVQYLEKGTERILKTADTVPGKMNQTTILQAAVIPGYTPEEESQEYFFHVESFPVITFYYTADKQVLTVKYMEQGTTNELAASTTVTGVTYGTVDLVAATVEGYTPTLTSDSYTFTAEENQTYIFNYIKNEVPNEDKKLIVNHLDGVTGAQLIAPEQLIGKQGDQITLTAGKLTVSGVTYRPEITSHVYTFTSEPVQEYNFKYFVYNEPVEKYDVNVFYVNRSTGEHLKAADLISGYEGQQLQLRAGDITVEIAVYNPDGGQTVTKVVYAPEQYNYLYTLTNSPEQSYTFYYNLKEDVQNVTVKYLEKGTNRVLAESQTLSGKVGSTIELKAKSINNYRALESSTSYKITEAAGQEYIFYYENTYTPPTVDPRPPVPPLPPKPPVLDLENHYNYIQGYPDGMIRPNQLINREEVATIFYRLMDDESRETYMKTTNTFSDVEATRWSNKYISTMQNAGIIEGYPDGSFHPFRSITRAEFAAIAARFDKLDERPNTMFSDISGHWAEKYIASAANKGWIKGYPDGTFKPDQYITRAEAMTFINSVLNRKVTTDGLHEDTIQWPDNLPGQWYYLDVLEATNHHEYAREEDETEIWDEVKPVRIYP